LAAADTSGVVDVGASEVLPQAEERTSQKIAGILTTGKYFGVFQWLFNACLVDSASNKT